MKTILIIEDNADICENVGEILRLAAYKVLLATNGKEGVTLALKHKPDLILCDIMMPELDGYGVIHLLQKHPETTNIPFIFLTAMAERTELRRGMELGADDYITKPFSATELLNAVDGRLKKAEFLNLVKEEPKGESDSLNIKQVFAAYEEVNSYLKNGLIYKAGHQAFRLYQVKSGKVKTCKTNEDGKEFIVCISNAGEFFGYAPLLDGGYYQESAETLEESEIASITREIFKTHILSNAESVQQFTKMLADDVQEREEQLVGQAYNSVRKKVAEALIMLKGKILPLGTMQSVISISRGNLAAIAGTAKESLIRTLSDFRSEGLIEIRGSKDIIILQEKLLTDMLN